MTTRWRHITTAEPGFKAFTNKCKVTSLMLTNHSCKCKIIIKYYLISFKLFSFQHLLMPSDYSCIVATINLYSVRLHLRFYEVCIIMYQCTWYVLLSFR